MSKLEQLIKEYNETFVSILPFDFNQNNVYRLDLSVNNLELTGVKDNDNFGDYGPTIILEHCIEEQIFYTLYGHLAKTSLKNIKVGGKISKGETFAEVGNSSENGNWPPHLHFQIISDMKSNSGDFPGVSSKQEKNKWLGICPDPSLIIYP